MSQIEYTLRIPYNKANGLVNNCKDWDYDELIDVMEEDEIGIKYIDNISSFFYCCYYCFEDVKLSICPKNFDLIVNGSIDTKFASSGNYECYDNIWRSLSDYTRDFQIVIDYPKEEDEDDWYYTKRILRKKDGKFEIYYIDSKKRVSKEYDEEDEEYYEEKDDEEDNKKYLNIDPSIFDKNYCDEGSGKDFSLLLTEEEKKIIYIELKYIYGIESKKEDYLTILDKLNIK